MQGGGENPSKELDKICGMKSATNLNGVLIFRVITVKRRNSKKYPEGTISCSKPDLGVHPGISKESNDQGLSP